MQSLDREVSVELRGKQNPGLPANSKLYAEMHEHWVDFR
jgi:hypothetical protein